MPHLLNVAMHYTKLLHRTLLPTCVALLAFTLPVHAFAASVADDSTASSVFISGVTPIDPIDGALPVSDVVVSGGYIQSITATGEVKPAAASNVIDGEGHYLIPGLWDMHAHFSYDENFAETMADLFVSYGITSVRDTGGPTDFLIPFRDQMEARGSAPRIYLAGPLLDGIPTVYDGHSVPEVGEPITSTAQAKARVNELAALGVDFIKIYEMVTPEVFHALVAAATDHQLPIAAHVPLRMRARDAAPPVQSLEHFRNLAIDCAGDAEALLTERIQMLDAGANEPGLTLRSSVHGAQRDNAIANEDPDECAAVIASLKTTTQVPTIRLTAMTQYPPFEASDWNEALEDLPEPMRASWKKAPEYMDPRTYRALGQWALELIPRLDAANVTIGAGTDTPIGWAVPGYSLHREMEILRDAGLTHQQALQAATTVPAAFFGIEEQRGRIKPGFEADLLLLSENPLDDIRHTRSLEQVILRGEPVESTGR